MFCLVLQRNAALNALVNRADFVADSKLFNTTAQLPSMMPTGHTDHGSAGLVDLLSALFMHYTSDLSFFALKAMHQRLFVQERLLKCPRVGNLLIPEVPYDSIFHEAKL